MNSSSAVSANPDVVIATVVSDIARDFLSLADVLKIDPRFTAQVSPESIHDEFSRFKLWAGNIAAHRKGRRSLEYRLRDAAHLKTQTLNLLSALSEALHNALAIARGEKVPWDENVDSDSELSDEGSSKDDLQGSTELKQLLASTRTIITSLFRLSMAIRDPAPNNQSKSNLTIDKSFFEQHDIQHVKEKFPDSPMYLQDRLGRAISGRRQYLSYREEHHQKLTKNIEKIGFEKPTTEFTTNSTEATPIPGIGRLNSVNVLEEGEDAASQTSYAPSENANIRVPPLPKEAHNKDFFECPLCFLLVSIHTAAGWKQHVYRDLHPYCCTFEHCTTADRLYESRKSWFAHELEVHRTSWQCIEGCGKLLQTEADFEHHVQKRHADLASNRLYHALKRTSAKSASLQDSSQCALCGKRMSLRALQKHLGSHQQQLALFALPPNLNETEEPNSQEEGSIIVKNNGDEDISDISDKPESENSDVDDAPDPGESSNTNDLLQDLQEIKTEWSSYIREQCEAFITRPPQGRLERETTFADLKNLVLFQIQTRLNRLKKVHILAKQCAELEAEVSGTVEWMCTVMNKYSVTTEDMTTVSSGGSFQEANVPLKNITSEASYPEERPLDSDSSHRAQSIPLSPSSIDKGLLQYSPQLPENFPILETRNESTPTPSKTIMMDLNAIDAQFEQEFLPLCHEFLTNQATEADLRKRQHQALSESILVSIILKLDKVETDGNEDARIKRKEIVKRVQSILNRLDAKLMGTSTVVEQPRKQYNPAANPGEANSTILDEREKNLELEGQVESYDQQLSDMYKSRDGPQIVPKVETSSQENEEALAPQEIDKDREVFLETNFAEDLHPMENNSLDGAKAKSAKEHQHLPDMEADLERLQRAVVSAAIDHEDLGRDMGTTKATLEELKTKSEEEPATKSLGTEVKQEMANAKSIVNKTRRMSLPGYEGLLTSKKAESIFISNESTNPEPIYAKCHKQYLAKETLFYYAIPFEDDGEYLILLKEMSQREIEVLFEHTRRLRSRQVIAAKRNVDQDDKSMEHHDEPGSNIVVRMDGLEHVHGPSIATHLKSGETFLPDTVEIAAPEAAKTPNQ